MFPDPGQRKYSYADARAVSWSLWLVKQALCFMILPVFFPLCTVARLCFPLFPSFSTPVQMFPFRSWGLRTRCSSFPKPSTVLEFLESWINNLSPSFSFLPTASSADACWMNVHFVNRIMPLHQLYSIHFGCVLLIILACQFNDLFLNLNMLELFLTFVC